MNPLMLLVLFIANMLALAIALSALFLALSQNPGDKTGQAVTQFLGIVAFYNFMVMLSMAMLFVNAPASLIAITVNMSVLGFALSVLSSFSLVVTLAGLMRQLYQILARAGAVVITLLVWPVWTGEFFTSNAPYYAMTHYGNAGILAVIVALFYIFMTLGVGIAYRRTIGLVTIAGIVILLIGQLLVIINPMLREIGFASLISVAASLILGYQLSRMRLFNPLRMQKAQLDALRDISQSLAASKDLPKTLNIIAQQARQMLEADMSVILVHSSEQPQELTIGAQDGGTVALIGRHLPIGEGLNGRVFATRQTVRLRDYSTWQHQHSNFHDVAIYATMSIPLLYGDEIVGILNVSHQKPGRQFSERQQATLEMLAPQAAVAIANAHLRERLDSLNG